MSKHNPLNAFAADSGVNALGTILQSAADGAAVVAAIRGYLETVEVQDSMVRQILNLYRMVRLSSANDSQLIDDALAQL